MPKGSVRSTKRNPVKRTENSEQIAIVAWAWHVYKLKLIHYPCELMRFLTEGQKYFQLNMGTRIGMPDLFLLEPSSNYHGLVIEMKSKNGKLSIAQKEWLKYFEERKFKTAVCFSFEEACMVIEKYLGIGQFTGRED